MSLSFWFRDFVFMRLVMVLMRNKSVQESDYHLKCCLHYQYVGHGLLARGDLVLHRLWALPWAWTGHQ